MVPRYLTFDWSYHYGSEADVGDPGPVSANIDFLRSILLLNSRTDGGRVPNFRQRINQGLYAGTNFNAAKVNMRASHGRLTGVYQRKSNGLYSKTTISGVAVDGFILPTPQPSDTVQAEALKKFMSAIRDEQQSLQAGVGLGELKQTLSLVLSPAKSLRRAFDSYYQSLVKGRKFRKKVDKRRVIADSWLEFQFGALPLMSDIKGAMTLLARLQRRNDVYVLISRSSRDAWRGDTSYSGYSSGQMNVYQTEELSFESTARYLGLLKVPFENKAQFGFSQAGLTNRDFFPTVWELIPFSFVVDYFTNIGDVLADFATNTANINWAQSTVRHRVFKHKFVHGIAVSNPEVFSIVRNDFSPSSISCDRTSVSRSNVDPKSLIADFRFEIPGFKSKKWLNLAALTSQFRSITPY